jgi:PST family polysaccharide transporter
MRQCFEDHQVTADHGRQSVRGGAISVVARAINAIVQIGSVLFLARLLTPEDYGLVAMVTAVTGFGPVLVDLGTRDAVVQRARITEGEVSSLFWLTMTIGTVFTILVASSGPLIAGFYNEPRVIPIALVSSLTFFITALISQHQALLRRCGMFRELAIVDIVANVLSASGAITMASFGLGYWALVSRPVAMYSLTAVGTWFYCRWVPGRPVITSGVKEMVKFGLYLTGFSLTDFVGRNSDRAAIGRGLGARTLGYYQNALFVYDNVLDVIVLPLHQVAVTSLSKLQHDLNELRRSWAKALSTVAFYTMPTFGILAITGQDVIVTVLGKKWAEAGALLSVLALRGLPHSAERTLGWLHVAAGRTDRWLRWGVFAACVQLAALFCGLPFGPFGVILAYAITMYLLFVPALAYAGHPLGIRARDVINVVKTPLGVALFCTAIGFGLRFSIAANWHPLIRVAVLSLTYIALYLMLIVGVFRITAPLQVCKRLLEDVLPNRLKASPGLRMAVGPDAAVSPLKMTTPEPSQKADV